MNVTRKYMEEALSLPSTAILQFLNRIRDNDAGLDRLLASLAVGDSTADLEADMPPATGVQTTFADGRYEIVRPLGAGGQKSVYLAMDRRLERQVVISVIRGQRDQIVVDRFLREARAMAHLDDHAHIVSVYDYGEESGNPYIVCQYMPGGSLAAMLGDPRRPPLVDLLQRAEEIADALEFAHAHDIVHRDVKPANIWLSQTGAAKLGDFGLATLRLGGAISGAKPLLGTPLYLAPERLEGRPSGPAVDWYSFGVVLYEMATGRLPFVADSVAGVLWQHMYAAPAPPSIHDASIPAPLDDLILGLLRKDPAARLTDASTIRESLRALQSGSITTRPCAFIANPPPRDVFIGREQPLAELHQALARAAAGSGRIVLVSGDAGSGKTCLINRFLDDARARGVEVHAARCHEHAGAPAFWPWVQILRDLFATRSSADLKQAGSDPSLDVIAELDPVLRDRLPPTRDLPALGAPQARFRLFDSFSRCVRTLPSRPCVLFIDDLHWADESSLRLLRFLASDLHQSGLLVIGAYRESERSDGGSVDQAVSTLADTTTHISLEDWTRDEVLRFMTAMAGSAPSETAVNRVFQSTEGNPFFVSEVVRLLATRAQLTADAVPAPAIPARVRDVIDRQLQRLDETIVELLAAAAVVGAEFDAGFMATVLSRSADAVAQALDDAVRLRLLHALSHPPRRYAFSHALVRERLYQRLPGIRRAELHDAIAQVLERRAGVSDSAAIAYHCRRGPTSAAARAITYGIWAGDHALKLLAYEQAAEEFRLVLETMGAEDRESPLRCDVLLKTADAMVRAGQWTVARRFALDAADLSERHGWSERLARAALSLGAGLGGATADAVDHVRVEWVETALRAIGADDRGLRSRLLAQLCFDRYHTLDLADRDARSLEAVRLAEHSGDAEALSTALYTRCLVLEGSPLVEERLRCASEIVAISDRRGSQEMALTGHFRQFRELMELCRVSDAEAALASFARGADALRQPRYAWYARYCRAGLLMFYGRFAECEQVSLEAAALARRAEDPIAELFLAILRFSLFELQGRLPAIETNVRALVERFPLVHWRSVLALFLANVGKRDEARAAFESLAARDFADIPRDGGWATSIAALSFVSHVVDDRRRARQLYAMLLPHNGRAIVMGRAAISFGAAARWLGFTAETIGAREKALNHFRTALRENERMQAWPHVARCQYDCARVLASRRRGTDVEDSRRLLDAAERLAGTLGMTQLRDRIAHVRLSWNVAE